MYRPDRHSRNDRRRGFDDSPSYDSRPSRPSFGASRSSAPMGGFGPELDATVKWYNSEKGFGFVTMADGSGDVFLHGSVLNRAGHDSANEGDRLRVRVRQGQKGMQVAEVTSVTPGEGPVRRAPGPRSGGGRWGDQGPRPPRAMMPEPDMSTAVETRGVVKWFNAAKGFGFIAPEDGGKDVFVHVSALQRSGVSELRENAAVVVQVVQGAKGPEAATVRPV